jgi:hypothetical protein
MEAELSSKTLEIFCYTSFNRIKEEGSLRICRLEDLKCPFSDTLQRESAILL